MKIIHTADLHLGSALEGLDGDKAETRRREIRAAFGRIARFAEENGVRAVILAGDVFDTARPFMRDKKFFYDVISSHPATDFIYLRGNHDILTGYEMQPSNLLTFDNKWRLYRYDGADIYGAELPYDGDMYGSLAPRRDRFNIVVLHGQINADFNLLKLRNKNIDYLALGHIHSYSCGEIDARGRYAYCGCPEGRGFDETGTKGFILLDTDKRSFEFVPFAARTIADVDVDVTGCGGAYEMSERIRRQFPADDRAIVRFNLCGRLNFSDDRLAEDVQKYLESCYFHSSVKDRTKVIADYSAIAGEQTLKGQFCRTVLADNALGEDERARILRLGVSVLSGGGVEI